jgi:hypothetical protein
MAILFHALAALVLGNLRFASFFERAHSVFQIREPGFNHLMCCVATYFFAARRLVGPSVTQSVHTAITKASKDGSVD